MNRRSPKQSLAINLAHLMALTKMKKPELARKSGVSERMIAYILNVERRATIDTVEDLAQVFGLEGWHLIMPNLPDDIQSSKQLRKMIDNYLNSSDEGKDLINKVAEREAHYLKEA